MAIVKPDGQFVEFTDFIMEVTAFHGDDDGFGIIFGMDPVDRSKYYQTHMINDVWPRPPSDSVIGPHLKIKKRNGKECLPEENATTACHDLLGYMASEKNQPAELFPNGRTTSMDYVPFPYVLTYEEFKHRNTDQRVMKFTLVVKNGEARVSFDSADNNKVGAWADLGPDYVGGQVGKF